MGCAVRPLGAPPVSCCCIVAAAATMTRSAGVSIFILAYSLLLALDMSSYGFFSSGVSCFHFSPAALPTTETEMTSPLCCSCLVSVQMALSLRPK